MLQSTSKPRLTVRRRYSPADSDPWQREQAENLLAQLVARAYFTDHPAKAAGDTGLTQENKNEKHTRIRQ